MSARSAKKREPLPDIVVAPDEPPVGVSAGGADHEQRLLAFFRTLLRNEAAASAIARGAKSADETDYESAFRRLLERYREGRRSWSRVLGSSAVFVAGGFLGHGIARIANRDWAGGVEIAIMAVILGVMGLVIRFMLRPI